MNNSNNFNKYINGKNMIDSIINLANDNKFSKITEIDLINLIADFMQNNTQYEHLESFVRLADVLVEIIEKFNNNFQIKEKGNIVESLVNELNNLKKEIDNVAVKLYFWGKDKYNLIDKCTNNDVKYINDIDKDILLKSRDNNTQFNVLILSEETTSVNLDLNLYFDDIIYYDNLMNKMFDISEKLYNDNYDYNYLIHSLEECKNSNISTLIVGNSYPLTGIENKCLSKNSINMALSSQDLYYSYKIAKKAIKENRNIENCVIGVGYYLVNHDLSKGKSEYSTNMIRNVYYPIFKDGHHLKNIGRVKIGNLKEELNNMLLDYVFDLEFIEIYLKKIIYKNNNGYFNNKITREMTSILKGIKLTEIDETEKNKIGELRARQHNDLYKYIETMKEYKTLFNNFILFLKEEKVKPIVVIFPTTKYYNKFIDKRFENEFYKVLNDTENIDLVKVIDFSKSDIFKEEDYIDVDHLNEMGAMKITYKLNEVLECI